MRVASIQLTQPATIVFKIYMHTRCDLICSRRERVNMDLSEKQSLRVLMFPWLAHGHTSPFLELAKKLSDRKFDIYICSTPANLSSINNRITEHYSESIHLVELHLPDSLPELPPHYHTTNGLPPHLQSTLNKALEMAKPDFLNLLKSLQPDLLIVDVFLGWPHSAASVQGVPVVAFSIFGAVALSYYHHLEQRPEMEFPFPSIRLTDFGISVVHKILGSIEKVPVAGKEIVLVNSSREIDGKYMDYVSVLKNWEIKPLGALVQCSNIDDDDDDELILWLGTKREFSSVLVSFGSECFLNREEIEEIAHGLEMSNANFIWVVRAPKGDEMRVQESLPQGFVERVEGRGKIVEKWAPQVKILKHSSVAGFVSHCGWNSILESIDIRVPIIGVPIHLDQPVNARLLEELGVGVEVARDGNGRVQREEISKVIKDVVFGKRGDILRGRVEGWLRESVRSTCDGDMEAVVQTLTQLCQQNHPLT